MDISLEDLGPSNHKDTYTLYKDEKVVFASNNKAQVHLFLSFIRIWFPDASYRLDFAPGVNETSESRKYIFKGKKVYIALTKHGYLYVKHMYPHRPTEEQIRTLKSWGFRWTPFLKGWFMTDKNKDMNDIIVENPATIIELFKKTE